MVDLQSFVRETISAIVAGVAESQAGPNGGLVNASAINSSTPGGSLYTAGDAVFTRVDFDIAVSASTETSGQAGLQIWVVSGDGKRSVTAESVSRVAFSVPVQLPEGDQSARLKWENEWRTAQAQRHTPSVL